MSRLEKTSVPEKGVTDNSLSQIKNIPSVKDLKTSLINLREQHGYAPDGIWSDDRLDTAAQGIEIYTRVYNQASEQLKKYLNDLNIIQGFIGVRPVVGLGREAPETMFVKSHFPRPRMRDLLFLQVHEELQRLLETHTEGKIRLEKIDYRNVKYVNTYRFELMNVAAIQNIANENLDLFPKNVSPTEWLIQHPAAWPTAPQAASEDARIKEGRAGGISGFPRSASDKYSAESTSGIDWKKTLVKLIKEPQGKDLISRKVEHTPLRTAEEKEVIARSGLGYVHYSEADLNWTKDAAALLKHLTELLELPVLKSN